MPEEVDKLRREGWKRAERVHRLERRVMQLGGIVLGGLVVGYFAGVAYLIREADSSWRYVLVAVAAVGFAAMIYHASQDFYKER